MPKTLFIVGNDGSGKSTYARRLTGRLRGAGWRVRQVAYYDSAVRRAFRGCMERLTAASQRKRSASWRTGPSVDPTPAKGTSGPGATAALGGKGLLSLLWCYQLAMAVEWRLRDGLARGKVIVCERGFLDDLVSITEVLGVEPSERLVARSGRWFPIRRLYYLKAGQRVEYSRIVANDLTPELHQRKGERYEQWARVLEAAGLRVRRVDTGARGGTPPSPTEARR